MTTNQNVRLLLELIEKKSPLIQIKTNSNWDIKVNEIEQVGNVSLETMQELVGGYIEIVPINQETNFRMSQNYTMYCDEESKMKDKPINSVGTTLHNTADCVAGDIILVHKSIQN
jgi:hypothetical protein